MRAIIAILMFALLFSCKNQEKGVDTSTQTTTEITTIKRDSAIKLEPQRATYVGRLFKDSTGRLSIAPISSTNTKHIEKPVVKVVDSIVYCDCEAKARELFIEWREKYKKTHTTQKLTETLTVEREFTFLETAAMWLGRITALALLIFIIVTITKIKFPIKTLFKHGKR